MKNSQRFRPGPTSISAHSSSQTDSLARSQAAEPGEFHVIGIGASAGGLEALEQFFAALPPEPDAAIIVVQHLSPDFDSHMCELLARHTPLPVVRVEHEMQVHPNVVYLIPPRVDMVINSGRLLLTARDRESFSRPIDQFLCSLATDRGRYAVGVVLSGTGSDGTRGVCAIHDHGGLVLAQDCESAKFDGMPRSAAATGHVSAELPPAAIAALLARYVKEGLPVAAILAEDMQTNSVSAFNRIFELLRDSHGIDFSHYKANTIQRRVSRRRELLELTTLEDYLARLASDPVELNELHKDLLIGVTNFFRDAEAFQLIIDDVIPEIVRTRKNNTIRVWVAGCATGEEAYSLAIAFDEEIRKQQISAELKIFATDAHRDSLRVASRGVYSGEQLKGVSTDRIERYFQKHEHGYQVNKLLRSMIIFAPHDVMRDAPFTQMNFVSCRNLLIYLRSYAQAKTLTLFNFALVPKGVLFLGPSETPGEMSEFSPIDRRWRIYRKSEEVRVRLDTTGRPLLAGESLSPQVPSISHRGRMDPMVVRCYDQLLARYMPPGILLDSNLEIMHVFGNADRLLAFPQGRMTANVLDVIEPSLKSALRAALIHCQREQRTVSHAGIISQRGGLRERLNLRVEPFEDPISKRNAIFICFQAESREGQTDNSSTQVISLSENERVDALERELVSVHENLQVTVEEMETTNEELQASNEELVASNEELQSTNEELHSVNEELHTVNSEHQRRVEELTQANDDMDNLLATTRVGVIFLDSRLAIRRFTPEAARVFHLLDRDIGRPFESFAKNIQYDGLVEGMRQTLSTGDGLEAETKDNEGETLLLRVNRYQSSLGSEGVVLTLVNVTSLKDTQQRLRRFRFMAESSTDGFVLLDSKQIITYANTSFAKMLGHEGKLEGMPFADFLRHEDVEMLRRLHASEASDLEMHPFEADLNGEFAEPLRVEINPSALDFEGHHFLFLCVRDVTERHEQRSMLEHLVKVAQQANQAKSEFLASMSHELRTPLTAVLGFADMLEDELETTPQQEKLSTIRKHGEYLLSLLNDILDLSKIEVGKLDVSSDPVSIVSLIDDVKALMSVRAVEEGVPLSFFYETEVPEHIHTDALRVRQILVNLIGNALKFTTDGEVKVLIRIRDRNSRQPVLEIEVRDTGIGMSEEEMSRLFQPFERGGRARKQQLGGTGLGLNISKRLADRLKGDIVVESRLNAGSQFTLQLYLHPSDCRNSIDASVTQSNEDVVHRSMGDGTPDLHARILLADDRRDIWRVARYFLEKSGARVTVAEDGRQAVDLAIEARRSNDPFDLVLMDMQMPVMNGREAIEQLRKADFDMPIIALTADAMDGEREACIRFGCDDFLPKPIDGVKLVTTVAKHLPLDER